jgi:hypothetical protein
VNEKAVMNVGGRTNDQFLHLPVTAEETGENI